LLTRTFYKRFWNFDRDFEYTYSAEQIGCHAAGKAAPRAQGRLAAHLIGIGRIHLHPKWQALWAELS
jgi:hypothetical protein